MQHAANVGHPHRGVVAVWSTEVSISIVYGNCLFLSPVSSSIDRHPALSRATLAHARHWSIQFQSEVAGLCDV